MDEAQQLLLWRWSTIAQVTSLAMAAAFFALLARLNRRAELRSWAGAWSANLLALVVTYLYWQFQPVALSSAAFALYLSAKMAFVLLLIEGVWLLVKPHRRPFTTRWLVPGLAAYAVAGAWVARDLPMLGFVQHATFGGALVTFLVVLRRAAPEGLSWLTAALALRTALVLVEAAAYGLQVWPPEDGMAATLVGPAGVFLSASSSFDTAVEWLVVLGCVLAVSDRDRRELQLANRDLIAAHEDLRRLADRDPLTALANRRSLPEIFRAVQPHGALLLFFDLDGFKRINDERGHAAGDAALRRFAGALRDSFRPHDHVIRYGGDEFLVVADGLDTAAARVRVDEVRRRMMHDGAELVCGFSVGMAELAPGGRPEAALAAADAQMYKAKHTGIA